VTIINHSAATGKAERPWVGGKGGRREGTQARRKLVWNENPDDLLELDRVYRASKMRGIEKLQPEELQSRKGSKITLGRGGVGQRPSPCSVWGGGCEIRGLIR